MTKSAARGVASSACAASIALGGVGIWFHARAGFEPDNVVFVTVGFVLLVGFATAGMLVASRQPGNAIGWIFVAIGLTWAASMLAQDYAQYALARQLTSSTIARVADWSGQWSWMPVLFLGPTLLGLLFPNGRPLSRMWGIAVWVTVGAVVLLVLSTAFAPGPLTEPVFLDENPFALPVPRFAIDLAAVVSTLGVFSGVVASLVSLVLRLRRSRGDERQQMKWLAFALFIAVALAGIGYLIGGVAEIDSNTVLGVIVIAVNMIALACIPVAAGVAILRYRLYDIDVVINKTVVYGALASFITVVYVAIVVGVGRLFGAHDEPNVGLQIAATGVVAVAFQPVRQRVQRVANRLVFGERATPYEVMTDFANRIGRALSLEHALPQIAEAAGRGIGATSATIRLFAPSGDERSVTWPPDTNASTDDGTAIDVTYAGERVGSLSVTKRPGETLTPSERALLADVAAQAGLAFRNARLTLELEQRVRDIERHAEQLRRSRERLVTARDIQRRRLERDIREGTQQQLERIRGRLHDASDLIDRDGASAATLLQEVEDEAGAALERLRDLARGIFPPLLADEGIAAALEAHMRKLGASGNLSSTLSGARFDADIEAAVYFCCLQALQNAVRHAPGSRVAVRLDREGDTLTFAVRDDGRGFDPERVARGMGFDIMQDRIEAVGGTLEVSSSPGNGTTVTGRVPARAAEAVPV